MDKVTQCVILCCCLVGVSLAEPAVHPDVAVPVGLRPALSPDVGIPVAIRPAFPPPMWQPSWPMVPMTWAGPVVLTRRQIACIVGVVQNFTDPLTHAVSSDIEDVLPNCFRFRGRRKLICDDPAGCGPKVASKPAPEEEKTEEVKEEDSAEKRTAERLEGILSRADEVISTGMDSHTPHDGPCDGGTASEKVKPSDKKEGSSTPATSPSTQSGSAGKDAKQPENEIEEPLSKEVKSAEKEVEQADGKELGGESPKETASTDGAETKSEENSRADEGTIILNAPAKVQNFKSAELELKQTNDVFGGTSAKEDKAMDKELKSADVELKQGDDVSGERSTKDDKSAEIEVNQPTTANPEGQSSSTAEEGIIRRIMNSILSPDSPVVPTDAPSSLW